VEAKSEKVRRIAKAMFTEAVKLLIMIYFLFLDNT